VIISQSEIRFPKRSCGNLDFAPRLCSLSPRQCRHKIPIHICPAVITCKRKSNLSSPFPELGTILIIPRTNRFCSERMLNCPELGRTLKLFSASSREHAIRISAICTRSVHFTRSVPDNCSHRLQFHNSTASSALKLQGPSAKKSCRIW